MNLKKSLAKSYQLSQLLYHLSVEQNTNFFVLAPGPALKQEAPSI